MKKILGCFVVATMMLSLLSGCGSKVANSSEDDRIKIEREENEIIIWSYYGGWEEVVENFEKKYKDLKVTVREFTYDTYEGYYLKALLSGEVPDLMVIDSTDYGTFNSMEGLENLYDFGIEKYKEGFDEEAWEIGKSFSGNEMLGVAFASAPRVTYYRADIMKKYGFPHEPEELGKFMETKENYLDIARTLKKDGISIMQFDTDPVTFTASAFSSFDKDLNFVKDTDKFKEAIDIAKIAADEALPTYQTVWDEKGLAYLKSGNLAMVQLGSWGSIELENWVPEQKGLWRVTRLPLNVYGWNNSSIISMPEKSPNKEGAMKFLEYFCFDFQSDKSIGSAASYTSLRRNEESLKYENKFLGGQKEQVLYEDLMDKTRKHPVTPLDKEGNAIIDNYLNRSFWKKLSTEGIIEEIKDLVDKALKEKKQIILESKK